MQLCSSVPLRAEVSGIPAPPSRGCAFLAPLPDTGGAGRPASCSALETEALAHALLPACGGVTAAGAEVGVGTAGIFLIFTGRPPAPATVLPSDSIPAALFSRKGSGIRRGSGGAAAGPPPRPQPAPPRAAPLVAPPAGAQGQLHFSPPAARKLASPRILRLPLPSCAAAPGPPQPPPRDCLPSPSPPAPPARRARTRVAAAR